jgi:hypothetical protein
VPTEAPPVAKKKVSKPAGEEQREDLIALRCRSEYKAWVVRFAKREYSNPTLLIERALAELAKVAGFEPPPER